jgi:hypothetical protein
VTSARISGADYATDVAPERRIAAFAELVRERARDCEEPLDIEADVLATEALDYGTSVPVYPIHSANEIESAFADAGLTLDVLDVQEQAGRVPAERAGPGSYVSATYARLVARAR